MIAPCPSCGEDRAVTAEDLCDLRLWHLGPQHPRRNAMLVRRLARTKSEDGDLEGDRQAPRSARAAWYGRKDVNGSAAGIIVAPAKAPMCAAPPTASGDIASRHEDGLAVSMGQGSAAHYCCTCFDCQALEGTFCTPTSEHGPAKQGRAKKTLPHPPDWVFCIGDGPGSVTRAAFANVHVFTVCDLTSTSIAGTEKEYEC